MKIFFKILTSLLTIIFVLSVCACDFDESEKNFYGGELLNGEKLSEIKESVFAQESKTEPGNDDNEDATEKNEKGTDAESEGVSEIIVGTGFESETEERNEEEVIQTVYWTKSGSVWHIDAECYRLRNSKEILSGTIEDAQEAGKDRVCSNCGK